MSTTPPPAAGLRRALVLALDGATFDVIHPLVEQGRLPNLSRWMTRGAHGLLRSTVPPVTFPAWSSFMTGLEPGDHGIFDFTQKVPGEYRLRFVNASDRSGVSLWQRVCRAGGRVLVLGMPATHPPEPVSGLLVTGFDAPVSSGSDERSANDPALYRRIRDAVGPWMRPGLRESDTGGDFHERALPTLLDRVACKERFALEALRVLRAQAANEDAPGPGPDLMVVVFSESDTVGHHYWRDHDPDSPRHDPAVAPALRGAIEAVYERLDLACGRLRQAFGEDALCVVLSDHGMGGASRRVVHLNRFLSERGLLARRASRRGGLATLARTTRDALVRHLPASLAQALFRRARFAAARMESSVRFAGFDWRATAAFSEEANTLPGVWINLAGRESRGCVAPGDYEATRDRVIAALLDWKLPGGEPVVRRALRREEVYSGPFVERAPDVLVELALDQGYGLSLVPTRWDEPGGSVTELRDHELAGGRGRGMNGTHRPEGIFVRCGRAASADLPRRLSKVAPWLLAEMGIARGSWPESPSRAVPLDYTPEEDALVAERLRVMGYIE